MNLIVEFIGNNSVLKGLSDNYGFQNDTPLSFSQRPNIFIVNQHLGNSLTSLNYIFYFVNKLLYEILNPFKSNGDGLNAPLLNFLKMYKLIIIPYLNPDTYEYLRSLVADGGAITDQTFISYYLKNMQQVADASDNCNEMYQRGINLRNNYNNNFKSGNSIYKCEGTYKGSNSEQSAEVQQMANLIRSTSTTFRNSSIPFVLLVDNMHSKTIQFSNVLMKPFSYDPNKEVTNYPKYFSLLSDSATYFQSPFYFGNYKAIFGVPNYGDPTDWLQETNSIETYSYFINNQKGLYLPNFSKDITLQNMNIKMLQAFYDNTLDILRRQGPYIFIAKLLLSECSLNTDIDIIGYCSGKYRSQNGTGDLIGYVDGSILWQLTVGIKNSGSFQFNNIQGNITLQLIFEKDGLASQKDVFYPEKIINATILDQYDSYYIAFGRPYGIMNEFQFNQTSENTLEFDLNPSVFSTPWDKKSTNLMFVFRDLDYLGGESGILKLKFKLNILIKYPFFKERKVLFSESFQLDGYKRDYDGSKMLQVMKIVQFAFSGQFIVLSLIAFANILYHVVNRDERDSFRKENPSMMNCEPHEQSTARNIPLLHDQETLRDNETQGGGMDILTKDINMKNPDQALSSSHELQRSNDSNKDIREFVQSDKFNKNKDSNINSFQNQQDGGAETEVGDNQSEIGVLSSFPDFKKSMRRSMEMDGKMGDNVNVLTSEEDLVKWQKDQMENIKKIKKDLKQKKTSPQLIKPQKQRAKDYNLENDKKEGQGDEELSRISEKYENSVDVSVSMVNQPPQKRYSIAGAQIKHQNSISAAPMSDLNISEIKDVSNTNQEITKTPQKQNKFDIKGNKDIMNIRKRQNNIQVLKDRSLEDEKGDDEILNRSYRQNPNQPLVSRKQEQKLNKSVEHFNDRGLDPNKTKKQAMQDRDQELLRKEKQNMKFFINNGLFTDSLVKSRQGLPAYISESRNIKSARKEESYIELSSVYSDGAEEIHLNEDGEFNLIEIYKNNH
ncbi:peptidase m14 carboxypeptidase a [Stylonychia lemnae]|uniref:Peptidase m14 carboxypeptidase a n=1 Tax=Stylonychia lemnae TaxID=5949 RepID=A0A077ZS20_STYLE|nr:peptidase m14 carboxypeptidase a [Stylonychia lemnae]|eukprot:CDW72284.1 peptidase m14 carboxypeptidase a [Stylonychia lemnae]